jgi:hypothetical protein
MRGIRLALVAAVLIGAATAATAGDMALTHSGELYRVGQTEDGLVVTATVADGTSTELLVPQTAGIVATSFHVGVEEITGAVFVVWQEDEGVDATVVFAHFTQGTWYGPTILAGGDGTAAVNSELLVFRHSAEVELPATEEPEEPEGPEDTARPVETVVVEDTFLHVMWWGFTATIDDGAAFYVALPLDEDGMPDFADFSPREVRDLLPFGIGCEIETAAHGLAQPRLFVDPETGNPHLFATDFGECLFQILELVYQREMESPVKRGRRVIIFGRSRMLAMRAEVNLATAKVDVGNGLSLVLRWDREDAIDYIRADELGWSEVQSLAVGENLTRDRAVDLIRNLTH